MSRFQKLHVLSFRGLMASSEVDQKFLGRFAKGTNDDNPFLSAMLFKVLGLSVQLSKKLIRARRLRRLDTTRDTKSLQLYHHIIWLAREGLIIMEEYVLPMVDNAIYELRVLSCKLRASFYHIFVLFHNQPSVHQASIPGFPQAAAATTNGVSAKSKGKQADRDSVRISPTKPSSLPPGLAPISIPKPAASFLIPAQNYIPLASSCFASAAQLADKHLQGSHPIRLSVKIEYSAYLYDCLHDGEASRKLAKAAVQDLYDATEGIDDEMFEDAATMLGVLGRMITRGLGKSPGAKSMESASTSGTPTPRPSAKVTNGEVFAKTLDGDTAVDSV